MRLLHAGITISASSQFALGIADPSRAGDTGIQTTGSTDPAAVHLIEAAGLRDACDLDMLLFFSRHPRVVLSSEQLAIYVGYELARVARSLDLLLGAGLLKRKLNQGAPGRMYVFEVDHAGEWLGPLRQACATPDGRNALKTLIKQRQLRDGDARHLRRSGGPPSS